MFDAPRDLVWKCFTDPEHMKQWWGPKGVTVVASKMDLRLGGTYHYGMKAPDGSVMWGKMVYREIVPPEKLVFINSFSDEKGGLARHPMAPTWPIEMLSVFTFEEQPGGKTKFTVRWSPHNATDEERKTFDAGHASMNAGLERHPGAARSLSGESQGLTGRGDCHELRRWICSSGAEEEGRRLSQHGEALRQGLARSTARWRFTKASPTTCRTASGPRSRAA